MKLSDFDYNLPKELIAQYPSRERGEERLLVLDRKDGSISHRDFADFIDYLDSCDTLIMNDAKVVKARLIGRKQEGGRQIELLLLGKIDSGRFHTLIKPLSKIKIGDELIFNGGKLKARVLSKDRVEFNTDKEECIYEHGIIPLPPYIKRLPEPIDEGRYQTVFASSPGAIASPTAGLHFTPEALNKARDKGVKTGRVTLRVGYGTFRPVRKDEISEHHMDEEYCCVGGDIKDLVCDTRDKGGKVFAVGTTTVRALESAFMNGASDYSGFTDLFIYPGFKFKAIDSLLTNFHLPRTTLLMLVSAFAGRGLVMKAYEEAVRERYRFYSYGDAMLII
ncbi:MAG: tRNA preQ1(34) S-adenosylmethionine ribosyltransferase-isomerase QueA [Candidatus Omnitrophica bacterium]|nr:tRNA preQ1(34) S-adenosylmethionine ribosyltransferase-isomerase QueA [Candidatus Omnitrophota bacterium]